MRVYEAPTLAHALHLIEVGKAMSAKPNLRPV
jgi:hypothetical protein